PGRPGPVAPGRGPEDSVGDAPWPLGARPRIPGTTGPSGPAGYRSGCCPGRQVGVVERPALAASSQNRRNCVMNPNPQPPVSLWPDRRALGPITGLYQLTMMAGYHASGMAAKRATFELFVRRMPPHRAYLVVAGLEQAIGDLLTLAFSADQIDGIRRFPTFAHAD